MSTIRSPCTTTDPRVAGEAADGSRIVALVITSAEDDGDEHEADCRLAHQHRRARPAQRGRSLGLARVGVLAHVRERCCIALLRPELAREGTERGSPSQGYPEWKSTTTGTAAWTDVSYDLGDTPLTDVARDAALKLVGNEKGA